jgi:hypothetical protein
MKRALQDAHRRAQEVFLRYPGVVGVGYGPKFTKGREVTADAIIVLVARKLAKSQVPKAELIPATFEGFATDVREPVLNINRGERADPNTPPDDPRQECLTDNEWIDWGKIHELNLEQHRREGGPRESGAEIGDEPADVPTTETIGDLFVIRDPTASLVTTVGTSSVIDYVGAYNLLRATFGDDYDFVSFYIDVGSGMPDVGNASNTIFNSTTGIGLAASNSRSTWSSTRILRRINHTWFSLRTLMHEAAHQWLFFVDYRNSAAGATQNLLHQDFPGGGSQQAFHWGRWPDNDISSLDYDRADWIDNGDGTFNRVRHFENTPPDDVWFGFQGLEEYLMGLVPASDVSNLQIVQSPTPAISDSTPGPYTPGGGAVTVGVANVQWEEGARSPDYLNTQRVFHHAAVVITQSSAATSTFITNSESWRSAYTGRFRAATTSRLMVDTSLLRVNHADLYVKDNDADTGTGTSGSPFWRSPDLWVRNANDGGTDHQCPIRGQANWVKVRVRNRGTQPYANVTVNVYLANFLSLAPGTEFFYPDDWDPAGLVGSAVLSSVPAASGGTDGTAIATVQWPAGAIPPAAGWHPCLLTEVIPLETSPSGLHHVWDNRRLAQRNLTIINPAEGCPPMGDTPAGDAQAYQFMTKFIVGHRLRVADTSELRVNVEGATSDMLLFLDPGGLLEGLETEATRIDLPGAIGPGWEPSPEESVGLAGAIRPGVRHELIASGPGQLQGNTIVIPAGTEIGLLGSCDDAICDSTLWLRFCAETRIQLGHRVRGGFARKHRIKGMRPVVVNGTPLLWLEDPAAASAALQLGAGRAKELRLIGIVSPFRRRSTVECHISEAVGGQVVGGLTIQIAT